MNQTTWVLQAQEVHLWRAVLDVSPGMEHELLALLNPAEQHRAARFHFPVHRSHFIVARGILRLILSQYLAQPASSIEFQFGARGKPSVANTALQFNLSHSHAMAVYALTLNFPIGVDIEKVENEFSPGVAARYFSPSEYASLQALPISEQTRTFYRIWVRKEAVLKAAGIGLHGQMTDFSVLEPAVLEGKNSWQLQSFCTHPDYESAFATNQNVSHISYYEWGSTGAVKWLDMR